MQLLTYSASGELGYKAMVYLQALQENRANNTTRTMKIPFTSSAFQFKMATDIEACQLEEDKRYVSIASTLWRCT